MLKLTSSDKSYPSLLKVIPGCPEQLYVEGASLATFQEDICLAVVGSRKVSSYGRQITQKLVGELARRGVVIVSGLAYGVDGLAHRAALEAGGRTIAVLPAGLDNIYPVEHQALARQILSHGGALVSEYPPGTPALRHHFIARNRIVSGLSRGVLITEAAAQSGTLHTANFALEQGREVLAVPGNITSPTSAGTNGLIKTGATPITGIADILDALHLEDLAQTRLPLAGRSDQEIHIIELLGQGVTNTAALLNQSQLDIVRFNQIMTTLEIEGVIRAVGSGCWQLA